MFYHIKELQYQAKPTRPDPSFARQLQEILGGQFGEMTVMMQYLLQGWNCRAEQKYRDLLLDLGTEEISHVEIVATLIARLLDGAPASEVESAAEDPFVNAVLGGMSPRQLIASGLGALPEDSEGVPWNGRYTIASGNLLADFRANLAAESQSRLQTARLYELTDDPAVRDSLAFLIARDTMHQNTWMAAIAEIEAKEGVVAPGTFPIDRERREFSYKFFNLSRGEESSKGRWAYGPTMDGCSVFQYVQCPQPYGEPAYLKPAPPQVLDTPPGQLPKMNKC
ncbi:manganese catalase [Bacillus canaveralius]|uniref:Manganese catalase n=1 Tax=Bacillus canaveralius TaxID=1403243 RepID=A0A2N5GSB1_9BACI|nr:MULTISPECIES: manganese catalase family protein [Bacillus]PLR86532.1 manganese catalase [Bacillus canaveralius]PLR87839.1 manganese catalase [Bacillus sp. V33-4]PLS00303.1 manganese catalase [Bacillus canaveralius]RSK55288.1 manganese catalase family protein [Bacillus canaveralius]